MEGISLKNSKKRFNSNVSRIAKNPFNPMATQQQLSANQFGQQQPGGVYGMGGPNSQNQPGMYQTAPGQFGGNQPGNMGQNFGMNPDQNMNFDVHANSKHYFPKDAEFLSNDYFSKPGKDFHTNKQAVFMNDTNKQTPAPKLEYQHPLQAQVTFFA